MSKGTVLVADDDRAIRTVLTQALGRAGFDVRAGDRRLHFGNGSAMARAMW